MSIGVAGGVDFPSESFVSLVADQNCADAQRVAKDKDQPLPSYYEAAAAACLAALNGSAELWTFASRGAAQALRPGDCIDRAVVAYLRRLVHIHRQHPQAQLRPMPRQAGQTFPCPRLLTISPEHGPSEGGYPLRMTGVHLPTTVVIHFLQSDSRDVRIKARSTAGGTQTVITVPRRLPGAEDTVTVYPEGWPLAPFSTPLFTYDRAAATTPSSTNRSAGPSTTTTTSNR